MRSERSAKRKRQKERQRIAAGRSRLRRRIVTATLIAGAVLAAAFGLIQSGTIDPFAPNIDLSQYQARPGDAVGTKVDGRGGGHIPQGQAGSYATPPDSGAHWDTKASWGIKDVQEPNERVVHNLEHGGILITYNGLSAEDLGRLRDVVRSLRANGFPKIVMEPYPSLGDTKVAVTAWLWSLKLPAYDEAEVVRFVRAHYQGTDAPERFAS
jgi:hypothetical protein